MDATVRYVVKWDVYPVYPVTRVFGKAGNRMGPARRYTLARLFLTLGSHQEELPPLVASHPEGFQILTRVSEPVLFRYDLIEYILPPRLQTCFLTLT